MKDKLIPSSWLEIEGRRLDCSPYLGGAVEAKMLLDSLRDEELSQLQKKDRGSFPRVLKDW